MWYYLFADQGSPTIQEGPRMTEFEAKTSSHYIKIYRKGVGQIIEQES